MASFFRWQVATKVIPFIAQYAINSVFKPNLVSSFVKVSEFKGKQPQLYLLWKKIVKLLPENGQVVNPEEIVKMLRNQGLPTAEGFIDITLSQSPLALVFTVDRHVFSKIVLTDIYSNNESMAKSSCLFQNVTAKNIVVDCKSPGIGQVFNMTLFRCAIHANFVANIHEFLGHQVTRVTQVEDSGLAAAALLTGYKRFGLNGEMETNAVDHLTEVLKVSLKQFENNFDFQNEVNSSMEKMENGDAETFSEWWRLKDKFLEHYDLIYKRVGLSFDDTHFDSSHLSEIKNVQNDLKEKGLLVFEDDGAIQVNIPNSDGLKQSFQPKNADSIGFVLSRGIFNAINRMKKSNFDEKYYIAPTSHKQLLSLVFLCIQELEFDWSRNLSHLRLKNISYFESKRCKKTSVTDMLNQAKVLMLGKLKTALQLEVDYNLEEMAEELGYANLCIYDMKHKRNFDYPFNWNEACSLSDSSGAALQLLHAGMEGLLQDSTFEFDCDIDTSPLLEQETHDLILHLSRFDEVVSKSFLMLEPCVIVEYLFALRHLVDRASRETKLDKKHVKIIVIRARLLLLSASLKVLKRGLHLLGIQPFVNKYSSGDLS